MNNLDFHKPVLMNEMLKFLVPKDGETYLDATFGAGGYSAAILSSAKCNVYAIDRDESAKKFAAILEKKFPKNFTFLRGKFSESKKLLVKKSVNELDAMIFDIGVSSMQFDDKSRGFSFDSDAKLDMRMDQTCPQSLLQWPYKSDSLQSSLTLPFNSHVPLTYGKRFPAMRGATRVAFPYPEGIKDSFNKHRSDSCDPDSPESLQQNYEQSFSAYEVVNYATEAELAKIIKEFGEEPKAKQIAKKIVLARKSKPVTSCRDLAEIVRSLYRGYFKTDPATRTFQALRIFVNQELEELKLALSSSITLLKKGGRLIVVSFHSLEDSIVKNFLKKAAGLDQTFSRYQPENSLNKLAKNFHVITKSAISPTKEEIEANPRARSSKMRVAIKL